MWCAISACVRELACRVSVARAREVLRGRAVLHAQNTLGVDTRTHASSSLLCQSSLALTYAYLGDHLSCVRADDVHAKHLVCLGVREHLHEREHDSEPGVVPVVV